MRFISFLTFLAPLLVAAIDIPDPTTNSTITKGEYYNLTWTSVDTDASTFSIFLVNFVNWPPSYVDLATDIETAAGSYSVYIPCDTEDAYGYQFNAINGTNVYVIYAQSPLFTVDGSSCTDPTTTTSSTCAAATVTVTVSGNSTRSSYQNNTASITSATATTTARTATVTSYGTCPDTIGWSSGYSHPVTLTSVPSGGQSKITAAPTSVAAGKATTAAASLTASAAEEVYTHTVYETVYASIEECGCSA